MVGTCIRPALAAVGPQTHLGTATGRPPAGAAVTMTDTAHYVGKTLGTEGCTEAFWRGEPDAWTMTDYGMLDLAIEVFPHVAKYPEMTGTTLWEAFQLPGGPGVSGAAQTLLRAGVAALLNASHPAVAFPHAPLDVLGQVDSTLATGDATAMMNLATAMTADNGRTCPIR